MEKYQNWELLVRYFAHECTNQEKQQIENWRKESEQNEQLFNEIKMIWENTSLKNNDFQPNKKMAWSKIEKRIEHSNHSKRRILINIYKYAALLVILIGTFCLIRNQINSNSNWEDSSSNTVICSNLDLDAQKVVLPDSSRIWLRKGASVEYPKDFVANRNLTLSGEAFFEVAKDSLHPFTINVGETKTKVLGTSFNLKESLEKHDVELSVYSGMVSFSKVNSLNDKVLTKGEQAKYISGLKEIKYSEISDPNLISWKTGVLKFTNNDMKYVSDAIARHYGIEAIITDKKIQNLSFTSTFNNESLENILIIIKNTLDISVLKTKNQLVFTKK